MAVRKLLIITMFDHNNYGQKLQNYAVQELVRAEGLQPFTHVQTGRKRGGGIDWKLLAAYLAAPFGRGKGTRLMEKRKRRFREFVRENIAVAELSWEQLARSNGADYDVYLTGSDQVWNNFNGDRQVLQRNFLRFAPRQKRVCFAPSFGFEGDPQMFREDYVQGIEGFDMLSCRERAGCDIIRRLTGREAELLCDPSMMLPVERWDAFARVPGVALPKRYVVSFFLGAAPRGVPERIERYAGERGLRVVKLRHVDQPQYYDTTPDEFVYILRGAERVFTNSFHACVFSILYHRNLTVFRRGGGEAESNMFSRIETLLDTFGLEGCMDAERMDEPVDYSGVDAILARQREKGVSYLHAALERALAGQS